MDDGVLAILGFVLIFVALDVAALRFGHDSRSMARELPLPGEGGVRIPRGTLHRVRTLLTPRTVGEDPRPSRAAPSRSLAPIARAQRSRRAFRPRVTGDVDAYPRLDLAAVGK